MPRNFKYVGNPKRIAATPQTVQDVAIRTAILDLFNRNQIPTIKQFASELGFQNGNPLSYFLKGERNFPKSKVPKAIDLLVTKYGMNPSFFKTGKGSLYVGEPFERVADINSFIKESEMLLTQSSSKKIDLLTEAMKQLSDKVKTLERMIADKDALIEAQRQILEMKK